MSMQAELELFQVEFNQALAETLNQQLPAQIAPKLQQAMLYSVSNGGKRLRPFLIHLMAKTLDINTQSTLPAAIALECIHSYSLVHDDLPAMDDDDLRRGKPTCHIEFDEATAILAGDALQTFAFELLANADMSANIKINWVKTLSLSAGYKGMCGGQSLDLEAENKAVNLTELETIHGLKTGALLKAAVSLACAAKPDLAAEQTQKFEKFAELIGLAFQIQDDILDITSTTDLLGKPQGSDQKHNKSTYPNLLGLCGAQQKAEQVFQSALEQIQDLPYNTQSLMDFAQFIIKRQH
ncbi:polyprenyl synthetase family protein [Catenovulum sp. 2E275]|uniref:polyprenyl synthetase family protein n=1 Tax=Catenovulum sp. 2E275 TaxID=2980497 RepID=UPI0021D2FBDE|nr:farnesyl diphosphate synthase [Catenovulum sp. 2E275]MCU4676836.1 polyprenyl synthetase family protein [Catenovulum sp. 2E275]